MGLCPEHGYYDDTTIRGCPQVTHTFPVPRPAPSTPFKCPCCDGMGKRSRPPWVGGDQDGWASSTTQLYECEACHGTGIVWKGGPA